MNMKQEFKSDLACYDINVYFYNLVILLQTRKMTYLFYKTKNT